MTVLISSHNLRELEDICDHVGIMHGDDLPVIDGDSIALRQPDMPHIIEAREAIGRLRSDIHHEVILYDLSEQNITRFKTNDYETIFGN